MSVGSGSACNPPSFAGVDDALDDLLLRPSVSGDARAELGERVEGHGVSAGEVEAVQAWGSRVGLQADAMRPC